MGRTCTICSHASREAIDSALVSRSSSLRDIARRYGLGKDALSRHTREHLPELLAKAHGAAETARADDLLASVRNLQARTLAILETAEESRQHRMALAAIREARSNLELLAKLVGELSDAPQVNVALSAEWIHIRTVLLETLAPYPEARGAVAGRLLELEAS